MKKLILLSSLIAIPILAGCGSNITDTSNVTNSAIEETTVNIAALIDEEKENWDNIGLHVIYDKDNENKVFEGDVEARYDRAKNLAKVAEDAVKIYFGAENTFDGKNKEIMDTKSAKNDWGDRKFELEYLKALESLTYDDNYTGIYVAAMVNTPINSDLTTTEDATKEVLFEVAFNGDEIEDFRLRDTNLDGSGIVEIFSPTEGYYSIDTKTGRVKKFDR